MSGWGAGGGQPENWHQAIFHPTLGRHAGGFSVRQGRGWKTPRLQINWGGARERTSENQSLVTQSSKVPSDVTLRGRGENGGNGRIVGARKIKIYHAAGKYCLLVYKLLNIVFDAYLLSFKMDSEI